MGVDRRSSWSLRPFGGETVAALGSGEVAFRVTGDGNAPPFRCSPLDAAPDKRVERRGFFASAVSPADPCKLASAKVMNHFTDVRRRTRPRFSELFSDFGGMVTVIGWGVMEAKGQALRFWRVEM